MNSFFLSAQTLYSIICIQFIKLLFLDSFRRYIIDFTFYCQFVYLIRLNLATAKRDAYREKNAKKDFPVFF